MSEPRWAYTGHQYMLGETDAEYGIWDRLAGTGPAERFPKTPEGWAAAWSRYHSLDPGAVAVVPALPESVLAEGDFKKRRVGTLDYGHFRRAGSIELSEAGAHIVGRHVFSPLERTLIIVGLLALDIALLFMAHIFLFGEIVVYMIVEWVWLRKADLHIPWNSVRSFAADPDRGIVAIDFEAKRWITPAALECPNWGVLYEYLQRRYASAEPPATKVAGDPSR